MNISPLVPTRARELDEIVARATPGPTSRLLLLHAQPGDGMSRLLAATARALEAATARPVRLLTGLPWEAAEPNAAMTRWGIELPPDTSANGAARALAHSLAPETAPGAAWDAIMLLDRAECLDEHSAQAVATLVASAGPARILVIAGCQPQTATGNAAKTLAVVASHITRLSPLQARDVAQMATEQGLDLTAHNAALVATRTAGSATLTTEVLDNWAWPAGPADPHDVPIPDSVRRHVASVWNAISPAARDLLFATALLATATPGPTLVEDSLAALGSTWDDDAIDELLTSGLVSLTGTAPTYLDIAPIIAAATLDRRGYAATAQAHQRVADQAHNDVLRLRHRWLAHPERDEDLATAMEGLAHDLRRHGDLAAAGDMMSLAAAASPTTRLADRRRAWAMDCFVGHGDLRLVAPLRAQVEQQRSTALGEEALGYLAVAQGERSAAQIRLDRAWELTNPQTDPLLASVIAQRQVVHHLCEFRERELAEWADRAVNLATRVERETAIESEAIRTLASCAIEGPDVASQRARTLAAQYPVGPVGRRVRLATGWLALSQDQLDQATEDLQEAASCDQLGESQRIAAWSTGWLARAHLAHGDLDAALELAVTGSQRARTLGLHLVVPLLDWSVVQVLALRGDWSLAEQHLHLGRTSELHYPIMRVPSALARAALCEARSDTRGILRALEPLDQPWAQGWIAHPGLWPVPPLKAEALVATGQFERAEAYLDHQTRRALAAGHETEHARLDAVRALLNTHRGDAAAAHEGFERATDLLAGRGLALDTARVQFLHARALRRSGHRIEARALVARARLGFEQMGAAAFVERCDAESQALAGTSRASSIQIVHGQPVLTAQETAVAERVAQGMSNKAVAEELFVSVKTVQYHLTRVYQKLGVRSRAELAARWGEDADG